MNWIIPLRKGVQRNAILLLKRQSESFINRIKSSKIIYVSLVCVFLSNCKSSKTQIAVKALKFQYSEEYCAGAAPSEAMLQQMALMKPFADKELELFIGNPMYVNPIIYKTNALGEIFVPSTLGNLIYVNLYPSINGFKNDATEFECYKKFVTDHLIRIDLTTPDKILNFSTVIQCNPCIPLAP